MLLHCRCIYWQIRNKLNVTKFIDDFVFYFHFVSANIQSAVCTVTKHDCMPSIFFYFSVKFFLYLVVCFPVFICKNPKPEPETRVWPCPNPKPGFRKRCPGLESLVPKLSSQHVGQWLHPLASSSAKFSIKSILSKRGSLPYSPKSKKLWNRPMFVAE